ncbi:hypothetical protein A2U01_0099862, partial [Trifolium medium]|nr:hypothetical protein [Trifolium medium]
MVSEPPPRFDGPSAI